MKVTAAITRTIDGKRRAAGATFDLDLPEDQIEELRDRGILVREAPAAEAEAPAPAEPAPPAAPRRRA